MSRDILHGDPLAYYELARVGSDNVVIVGGLRPGDLMLIRTDSSRVHRVSSSPEVASWLGVSLGTDGKICVPFSLED